MKNILSIVLLFCMFTCSAQNFTASINRNWAVYAEDTNLTYRQITHLCDSMFADAGFSPADTTEDTYVCVEPLCPSAEDSTASGCRSWDDLTMLPVGFLPVGLGE